MGKYFTINYSKFKIRTEYFERCVALIRIPNTLYNVGLYIFLCLLSLVFTHAADNNNNNKNNNSNNNNP